MREYCADCLSQEVCPITRASCAKLAALFKQRKSITNGRTTMSNTPKNVTPKTVAEAAEKITAEEATVPAQATAESKVEEPKDGEPITGEKAAHSLVQRLKTKVERIKKNKNAVIAIAIAAAVTGVVINNKRRKAVSVELLDVNDTTIVGVGEDDENPNDDSI